ncbi:MAG: aryl-sulfate sulfotransferase [Gemmataceae bacterium]
MQPSHPPRGRLPLLAAALLSFALAGAADAQPKGDKGKGAKAGVSLNDARAFKGYTLIAGLNDHKTYLIDMDGRVVNTWESDTNPGASAYLLDNGNLLRSGSLGSKAPFNIPAVGGRVQEFTWDGKLVWDYTYSTKDRVPHHDITPLPNGNVLLIISDRKSASDVLAAGRRPDTVRDHLQVDGLIEVKKTGPKSGEIVWEWNTLDHIIQDHDKTKPNFGKVSAHPELVDINYGQGLFGKIVAKKDEADKLRGLGYLGGPVGKGGGFNPQADWMHTNAVAYNEELDQIMLSIHAFNEIWIIDHGTSKAEAASHKGGKQGRGGDLLYRWGNPQAYRSGTNADQRLFGQHNAHWIPKGLPGAGNIIVFNNGMRRPDGNYSSVDEIAPPLTKTGGYERKPGLSFGPESAEWSYTAPKKSDFYAMVISGAHRLPNGNTIICSGTNGTVFEVTSSKEMVWKFVNPSPTRGGGFPGMGGKGTRPPFGGFGTPPGTLLPTFLQDQLKLTEDQKKQLDELQKEVTAKLDKMLTEEQRDQLKKMRDFAGGGFGPPGGGGGMGPGGFGGGGLFRVYRYGVDHPAFAGKTITPGRRIDDVEMK